jgi:hydrogenase maturation protease
VRGLRVIGVGRPAAGDDGVGPAVVEQLRAAQQALDLHIVPEPSSLVELLWTPKRVVIVDALRSHAPAGSLRWLQLDEVAARGITTTSHGVGVVEACRLAQQLEPTQLTPELWLLGISIDAVGGPRLGLSPAVEQAAAWAARLLAGGQLPCSTPHTSQPSPQVAAPSTDLLVPPPPRGDAPCTNTY